MGTAILGYKEGDTFAWRLRNRTRHIRIEKCCTSPRRLATSTCNSSLFGTQRSSSKRQQLSK